MSKNILIAIVIFAVLIIQISFIEPFVVGIAPISIVVLFLTLLVFRLELIPLLWWSFLTGALHEIYSIMPFGTFTIITILTTIVLYYLLKNLLTNKSLFPFVLMAIAGSIIYNLLFLAASVLFYYTNSLTITTYQIPHLWSGILIQAGVNGMSALILFLLLRSLTKRFQNQFLVRK
ncbi:MAG: hypothetical protein WC693_00385 [Patescibacteria group bacterium]|jgi:hypothetical protein